MEKDIIERLDSMSGLQDRDSKTRDDATEYIIELRSRELFTSRGCGVRVLTTEEQNCLDSLLNAWNAFLRLPSQHFRDQKEFMFAIHNAQNIVLARPTIRGIKAI